MSVLRGCSVRYRVDCSDQSRACLPLSEASSSEFSLAIPWTVTSQRTSFADTGSPRFTPQVTIPNKKKIEVRNKIGSYRAESRTFPGILIGCGNSRDSCCTVIRAVSINGDLISNRGRDLSQTRMRSYVIRLPIFPLGSENLFFSIIYYRTFYLYIKYRSLHQKCDTNEMDAKGYVNTVEKQWSI